MMFSNKYVEPKLKNVKIYYFAATNSSTFPPTVLTILKGGVWEVYKYSYYKGVMFY